MAIKKIEAKTIRQQVYEQLRQSILGAEFLPGEVVSLRGLADRFGVSLLPVREAVWQLESEGILVVKSNKRIEVNKLTRPEFDELLKIRLLLETTAIREACQKRPKSAVTKVLRILNVLEKYAQSSNRDYIKKNDQFHRTIYSFAESPMLLVLIQRLLARVNPYLYMHAVHGRDLSSALKCHHEIYSGFAEGDADKAEAALRSDLLEAAKVIRTHLD